VRGYCRAFAADWLILPHHAKPRELSGTARPVSARGSAWHFRAVVDGVLFVQAARGREREHIDSSRPSSWRRWDVFCPSVVFADDGSSRFFLFHARLNAIFPSLNLEVVGIRVPFS
jgi:hypothetical protein